MNKHQKVMAGIEKRINNLEAENKKLLDTLERYRACLSEIGSDQEHLTCNELDSMGEKDPFGGEWKTHLARVVLGEDE